MRMHRFVLSLFVRPFRSEKQEEKNHSGHREIIFP